MKRTLSNDYNIKKKKIKIDTTIGPNFLEKCIDNFNNNSTNIITRNAVVSVGSLFSATDSEEVNKISHYFMNTLKRPNLKATDQGESGRCWIFAGLNVFRHNVMAALDMNNFEFSETYIYFWDKFERANTCLQWFIDNHETYTIEHRVFDYMLRDFMTDGGYWNMFVNIVEKYGLVPKSAMPETYQSDFSHDMNNIINNHLQAYVSYIYNNYDNMTTNELKSYKKKSLLQIYNILVKFLGNPPNEFKWIYNNDDDKNVCIGRLSPKIFKNMLIPSLNLNDFVLLCNVPSKFRSKNIKTDLKFKYYKKYEINDTSNTLEGTGCNFINLPINELKKYARKSILSGMPVWFAGDMSKGFHPFHSTLNDKLIKTNLLFGELEKFNKSQRILFKNQEANHAMTLVGVNIDEKNKTTEWQVENSWGYYDNEIPGLDGFICMSDEWFDEYLFEVVIHKNYLSRNIKKLINEEPIYMNSWDTIAPSLIIKQTKHLYYLKKQYKQYGNHI